MKKFISTALALVMTLSLCTFVASPKAEAFADDSELSSQYAQQAADVIQKIEVMDGYDDGTFRPTAGLTRQAAAKIICNMILGPTTAKALPTNANPFPDVLSGNQFSGYISYCSQQGIISGYGDGTFRPGDPLSGYAYLKMLLGALGYDARHEGFVGDNWKVNVAKIALGIGLNRGILEDLDGATQVTRESAAIYAFNTLQADMVEYDSKNTLEINGVMVSMGGGNAVPQTWGTSSTSANHISAMTDNGAVGGKPIVQFAERYFDKLERTPNGAPTAAYPNLTNGRDEYAPDDFGRPSVTWTWKGVDIGTYSRDPDARFVGNVKVNAIYEALGMSSGNSTACLYINSNTPNNAALKVERGNDKDLDHANNLKMYRDGDADVDAAHPVGTSRGPDGVGTHRVDRIGDGCLIECFRNEVDNHVDVCVISVYGGKVDAVKAATAKKDAYVTIVYGSDAAHRPDGIDATGKNEYETEDFEEEDYVAYTYSDSAAGIKNMYLMDVESGVLESRVSGKNLKLDGVAYPYGKEYTFNDMTENDLSGKSSYIVYLFSWSDNAGYDDLDDAQYALLVEEDEFAVDQYVLIERIAVETKGGAITAATSSFLPGSSAPNDVQARVRTSAGTSKTVSLDDSKNYRSDDNTLDPAFAAGRIVRMSSNSNGYRLHKLDSKYYFKVNNFTIEGKTIRSGGASIQTPEGETLLVDSETHFTVQDVDNDTYKAYVGTKSVPDVKTTSTAYVYHRGPLAKQIFITSAYGVSSSTKDVVFLLAPSTSNLVESDDGDYYDVTAVNKDEVVTLRIKAGTVFNETGSYFAPGSGIANTKNEGNCVILNKLTYDSNDLVTAGDFDNSKVDWNRAIGIRRINSEEVRFDTNSNRTSYLRDVAENVRVFFADGSDIEQIDYSEIVNDTQDAVYYVQDDDVVTYIFIVNYEDDGIPAAAASPAPSAVANVNTALAGAVTVGYAVSNVSAATVAPGTTFTFQVQDTATSNFLTTTDGKVVKVSYVQDSDSAAIEIPAVENPAGSRTWSATIPADADLRNGSNIAFVIA